MELKVCPNPCASASAAEFNVSPARRESSSKALFEPLEMLKYCWVFPLSCRPSALRSHRGLVVPSGDGTRRRHPRQQHPRARQPCINPHNATPNSPSPGTNPIFSKRANARDFFFFFICYFKDHIFATEMKALSSGLADHLLKRLPDSSASTELIP